MRYRWHYWDKYLEKYEGSYVQEATLKGNPSAVIEEMEKEFVEIPEDLAIVHFWLKNTLEENIRKIEEIYQAAIDNQEKNA